MKKIFVYSLIITAVAGLWGCEKSIVDSTPRNDSFENQAIVQVFIATVNASRNYVTYDGALLNGVALSSGSSFPNGNPAATQTHFGSSLPSGIHSVTLRDTLVSTTQTALTFSENFLPGKNYTVFAYDTINSPKQKTVETLIEIPAPGTARLRFANFVFSKNAVPAIDIYSQNRKQNVATNLAVTDVSAFIPYESGIADTFYVRIAGSGTDLNNFTAAPASTPTPIRLIMTPTSQRSYTLVFRGSYLTTLTTATQVRTLTAFLNR